MLDDENGFLDMKLQKSIVLATVLFALNCIAYAADQFLPNDTKNGDSPPVAAPPAKTGPDVTKASSQDDAKQREQLLHKVEALGAQRQAVQEQPRVEEQRLTELNGFITKSDAYVAALKAAVRKSWDTSSAPESMKCAVEFSQITGGEVTNVTFVDCPYSEKARSSVEKSLLRSRMPYAGFEDVFRRRIKVVLCYPEEKCK